MYIKNKKKGFTLIELIIYILFIKVLIKILIKIVL